MDDKEILEKVKDYLILERIPHTEPETSKFALKIISLVIKETYEKGRAEMMKDVLDLITTFSNDLSYGSLVGVSKNTRAHWKCVYDDDINDLIKKITSLGEKKNG